MIQLPKQFEDRILRENREELIGEIRLLYSELREADAVRDRVQEALAGPGQVAERFSCHCCGKGTLNAAFISTGEDGKERVHPPVCLLCTCLDLGRSYPIEQCGEDLIRLARKSR